jgi:hypothetical protein
VRDGGWLMRGGGSGRDVTCRSHRLTSSLAGGACRRAAMRYRREYGGGLARLGACAQVVGA